MSWDPITRIVGSLGIHTEIDFSNQEVLKCYWTSMIFRGFDIFMKGIDPRDAHFITSRICGICGDNHCTCSCLNQNMAYGVKPPPLGDLAFNLAESADYMFDHAIFNDCMATSTSASRWSRRRTRPCCRRPSRSSAPHSDIHGYRTIADIMRSLNPFTGEFYLETLQVARYTREMYCLFGGRHTHPSTIMPGGCSAHITHQTLHRLLRAPDALLRLRQAHGADARRPLRLLPPGAAGVRHGRLPRDRTSSTGARFDDPDYVDYDYKNMTEWGNKRYITPGIAIGGELITTDLVEINLMIRILLGSSYFDDWTETEEPFVTEDPLGNPVDPRHPWNKVTMPKPQKRDFADKYSWVVSPRIYDERTDTLRLLRHRRRAVRAPVVHREGRPRRLRLREGDRRVASRWCCRGPPNSPEMELEWKVPEKSNAIERDRARTYHQAYSALIGLHCLERAFTEVRAGRTRVWNDFKVPQDAVSVRLPRGGPRRAVAPHGDPRRQDRQLPALSADAVERQRARRLRDSRPLRGRGAEHADLRGERPGELQGRGHHAGGAELRSVPAVRRPHVRRRRPRAKGAAHADRDVLTEGDGSEAADDGRRRRPGGEPSRRS